MFQSVDEYYRDTMEHGTPQAKILITEEALMAGNLAGRLAAMAGNDVLDSEKATGEIQRELMALLITHRSMAIANFLMERAEGHPMGTQGPVVTAKPLMEDGGA